MLASVSICEIDLPSRKPQAFREHFAWNLIPLQAASPWERTVKLFKWPDWNMSVLQVLEKWADAEESI